MKTSALAAGAAFLLDWEEAFAAGRCDKAVGQAWKGWKKGHFQVHFIFTGLCESMFLIFPDGTSMLLDCGDHEYKSRGNRPVPILPSEDRHTGEWIARYVQRVNPNGRDVDYMMLSHYHCDHGGYPVYHAGFADHGGQQICLSGFSHAAEYLNFGKAFDRCFPAAGDPLPLEDKLYGYCVGHMRAFYRYMEEQRGMQVETFRVGETGQVALRHDPSRYPSFSVFNICGNGRIAAPDGRIIDLYADPVAAGATNLNENGMSIGMVISYGPFRFYTAGDFSDKVTRRDGTTFEIEDKMAEVCGPVHVAKLNHHGFSPMPPALVSALRARVWVGCVWDRFHCTPTVMDRLADRTLYPGDRTICPLVVHPDWLTEEEAGPWKEVVDPACFDGCHVVLDVPRGGRKYSISYLDARDESMTVRSVMHFNT